nr:hypothetical protein [Pectobacterium polonicum]
MVHQPSGSRFTRGSFNAHWMKAKKKAEELHPNLNFDFTFHDLKAKGISDLDGTLAEKQAISGHMTISQTARMTAKYRSFLSWVVRIKIHDNCIFTKHAKIILGRILGKGFSDTKKPPYGGLLELDN